MDWESIAPFKILLRFSKIPEALNVVLRVSYIFFGFSTSFFEAGFLKKHADDYPFSTHERFAEKNNTRKCVYQGEKYVTFSENFGNVLNIPSLIFQKMQIFVMENLYLLPT